MENPTDPIHTLRELRALRHRLKLTQAELAGMLGVHRMTVQRMECGEVRDERRRVQGRRRRWATKRVLELANELLERWADYPRGVALKPRKCPLCGAEKTA
jgi:transcriptional regulator with XRE-family HTH domain